jgi:hypothetical protein
MFKILRDGIKNNKYKPEDLASKECEFEREYGNIQIGQRFNGQFFPGNAGSIE